jgi:hypothetical protein
MMEKKTPNCLQYYHEFQKHQFQWRGYYNKKYETY